MKSPFLQSRVIHYFSSDHLTYFYINVLEVFIQFYRNIILMLYYELCSIFNFLTMLETISTGFLYLDENMLTYLMCFHLDLHDGHVYMAVITFLILASLYIQVLDVSIFKRSILFMILFCTPLIISNLPLWSENASTWVEFLHFGGWGKHIMC